MRLAFVLKKPIKVIFIILVVYSVVLLFKLNQTAPQKTGNSINSVDSKTKLNTENVVESETAENSENSVASENKKGSDISVASENKKGSDNSVASENKKGSDNSVASENKKGSDNSVASENKKGSDNSVHSINSLNSCGNPYEKCNLGKPDMINVHLVSHSHNDLGWVQTVDQYYNTFAWPVRNILDSSIQSLLKNPERRFIYVEIGYFWRWWNQQNGNIKNLTRQLVNERRLEFTIGGWAMDDEATTYYRDIIDQHTLGLQFILKEFGECARPVVGWQIDPFGHSNEFGSQLAQYGFDGVFHGRVDHEDFNYRGKNLSREMIWKTSPNLGDNSNIFTVILPNVYDPPPGFCFDVICGVQDLFDDPNQNYDRISTFIQFVIDQSKVYKTKNLVMTMGADFQYSEAETWFRNLDKLIKHVNLRQVNGSKINLLYSTPSCYVNSLFQSNTTWPTRDYDDFFPYSSRLYTFWTGYYTSRPTLKYYVRQTSNFLQSVKHFVAFTGQSDDNTKNALQTIGDAMGILQHHDAVTGTAQQYVTDDYVKFLSTGISSCISVISNSFKLLAAKNNNKIINSTTNLYYCSLLNVSACVPVEDKDRFSIILYNPLGVTTDYWVRVPTTHDSYEVINLKTKDSIRCEFTEIFKETSKLPERKSLAKYELLFNVVLPPLGFNSYDILKTDKSDNKVLPKRNKRQNKNEFKNEFLSVLFDSNGHLSKITNLNTKQTTNFSQKFCFYQSFGSANNNPAEYQSSGAYVFRPNGSEICLNVSTYTFKHGEQFSEINQIYNEWISQTIRLYKNVNYVEFEWQVGPIYVADQIGREVVSRFQTDLKSGSIFYTDSNGREMLKRVKDHRSSWPNFTQTEPVAGNYYPINSIIYIRDQQRQFSIVNDRSQGGTSLNDGMIEIMVHRRSVFDDGMGVKEALNEGGTDGNGVIAKGTHYVFLDTIENSARLYREMALKANNRPLIMFEVPESGADNVIARSLGGWSALKNALPNNIHLLTLMKDYSIQDNNTLIIRFEHLYEKNEDPVYSQSAFINLIELLKPTFEIIRIEELALGANMKVSELNNNRLKFSKQNYRTCLLKDSVSIQINPMEIKTFRLWYRQ